MLCDPSVIKIIKSQMRYNRNVEICKKVFLWTFRYRNISLACEKLGYKRSYFWFNRPKQANFDIIDFCRNNGISPLSSP
jgi:hypothetical protein